MFTGEELANLEFAIKKTIDHATQEKTFFNSAECLDFLNRKIVEYEKLLEKVRKM